MVSIEGVRDKLRVLLVSGEPHAGERAWRNLLKSDAAVDLVHFTILRPPEKQDGTPINELSLIAFPTRELFQQKIHEFQLIIFDRYARQGVLPILYFDNIARYVRGGGAVLIAAGPDYASQTSLWRTPLEAVLPAEPCGPHHRHALSREALEARQAPPGDARARRLAERSAAMEPLVPAGRRARQQGHDRDGRPRRASRCCSSRAKAKAASRCCSPTTSGCGRAATRAAARIST